MLQCYYRRRLLLSSGRGEALELDVGVADDDMDPFGCKASDNGLANAGARSGGPQ